MLDLLKRNKKRLKRDPSRRETQDLLQQEYDASRAKLVALRQKQAVYETEVDETLSALYGIVIPTRAHSEAPQ